MVHRKISTLGNVAYLKSTFIKHAMFTLFTLASLLFSTTSMASIDEDIEQKARERHEQKWNEKIDYDVANTIRRCGEIYASRNREIDNYNNAVKEFRRYEHDKSEVGRAMRALARPAILRLEVEIDEIEQQYQYQYSCENVTIEPNIQTLYHACQHRDVMAMSYEMCGEAFTIRDDYDNQLWQRFSPQEAVNSYSDFID